MVTSSMSAPFGSSAIVGFGALKVTTFERKNGEGISGRCSRLEQVRVRGRCGEVGQDDLLNDVPSQLPSGNKVNANLQNCPDNHNETTNDPRSCAFNKWNTRRDFRFLNDPCRRYPQNHRHSCQIPNLKRDIDHGINRKGDDVFHREKGGIKKDEKSRPLSGQSGVEASTHAWEMPSAGHFLPSSGAFPEEGRQEEDTGEL